MSWCGDPSTPMPSRLKCPGTAGTTSRSNPRAVWGARRAQVGRLPSFRPKTFFWAPRRMASGQLTKRSAASHSAPDFRPCFPLSPGPGHATLSTLMLPRASPGAECRFRVRWHEAEGPARSVRLRRRSQTEVLPCDPASPPRPGRLAARGRPAGAPCPRPAIPSAGTAWGWRRGRSDPSWPEPAGPSSRGPGRGRCTPNPRGHPRERS